MRNAILFWLLLVSPLAGQVSIRGVEFAEPGKLIKLSPEGVEDARTTWLLNYPDEFEEFGTENKKLFIAMPKHRISFTLLVIPHDTTKDIVKVRHTIDPSETTDPFEPEPDPDPKEPDDEITDSPLYQAVIDAYAAVKDPDKLKWGGQIKRGTLEVARKIKAGEYPNSDVMMADYGAINRGETDGYEPWPDDSRRQWVDFRDVVNDELDTLEKAGQLKLPVNYWIHFQAIAAGLTKGGVE